MPETHVRSALAGDYPAFVHLFPQLGAPDETPSAARWEIEMVPGTLIAEIEGAIAGYAFAQTLTNTGYVRNLVVAAEARRRGVGKSLMGAMAERFHAAGCEHWCLNVRPENAAAIALYEGFGLRGVRMQEAFLLPWDAAAGLAAPGRAVHVSAIAPAEDAAIELRFGLPPGQVTADRARGRVLLVAKESAEILGFSSFDIRFGGSFPFRIADAAAIAPLVAGCRAYADRRETIRLVAEDDPVVADALRTAGGVPVMRTLHMTGRLPGIG